MRASQVQVQNFKVQEKTVHFPILWVVCPDVCQSSSSPKPQGTVKTRYFLLYLARMHVRCCCDFDPLTSMASCDGFRSMTSAACRDGFRSMTRGVYHDRFRPMTNGACCDRFCLSSRPKPQGTVKTWYFLLYLARMYVGAFLRKLDPALAVFAQAVS